MIDKNGVILVTGSTGMVGSNLANLLKQENFKKILLPTRQELDLLNASQVDQFFAKHQPDYVFMIAAKVGGIAANRADPVGFLKDNVQIALNLFNACYQYKTQKNLFLGSSCIYPKESPQPMKEEYLLTGPLEPTNEGYALGKIIGIKLAQYYYEQHGMITACPMPSNIYGTNDIFDLDRSHVLSALVKRFVDAKDQNIERVTLWGTGVARREFIHVSDVAAACVFIMNTSDSPHIINLGTGTDISIRELATAIAEEVGFCGEIAWDSSKPDGMLRKCMDITKLNRMGFKARVSLSNGIRQTIDEYRQLKLGKTSNE